MAKKSNVRVSRHPFFISGLPGLLGAMGGLGFALTGSIVGYWTARVFALAEQPRVGVTWPPGHEARMAMIYGYLAKSILGRDEYFLATPSSVEHASRLAIVVPWVVLTLGLLAGTLFALQLRRILMRREEELAAMLCRTPRGLRRIGNEIRLSIIEWPMLALCATAFCPACLLARGSLDFLWAATWGLATFASLAVTWEARKRVYDAACAMEAAQEGLDPQERPKRSIPFGAKIVAAWLVAMVIAIAGFTLYFSAKLAHQSRAVVNSIESLPQSRA